jgi:hypothetical protein
LPFAGTHISLISEAKHLQIRIREENKVISLLEHALSQRDLEGLRSAIAAAGSMRPAFAPPVMSQAQAMVAKIEAEIACKSTLLEL